MPGHTMVRNASSRVAPRLCASILQRASIRGTTTSSGLTVRAVLERGIYPTGQKITDAQMDDLRIERHAACPQWNYTLRPRTPDRPSSRLRELNSELWTPDVQPCR